MLYQGLPYGKNTFAEEVTLNNAAGVQKPPGRVKMHNSRGDHWQCVETIAVIGFL